MVHSTGYYDPLAAAYYGSSQGTSFSSGNWFENINNNNNGTTTLPATFPFNIKIYITNNMNNNNKSDYVTSQKYIKRIIQAIISPNTFIPYPHNHFYYKIFTLYNCKNEINFNSKKKSNNKNSKLITIHRTIEKTDKYYNKPSIDQSHPTFYSTSYTLEYISKTENKLIITIEYDQFHINDTRIHGHSIGKCTEFAFEMFQRLKKQLELVGSYSAASHQSIPMLCYGSGAYSELENKLKGDFEYEINKLNNKNITNEINIKPIQNAYYKSNRNNKYNKSFNINMNFNKGLSNGNIKQTIQSILAGTIKCPRRTNCNGYFMVNGRSGMNRGLSNDNESIISGGRDGRHEAEPTYQSAQPTFNPTPATGSSATPVPAPAPAQSPSLY